VFFFGFAGIVFVILDRMIHHYGVQPTPAPSAQPA
jgi:hypothetical protein